MNWLIYIGGFFLFGRLFESIIFGKWNYDIMDRVKKEDVKFVYLLCWTATWIWICWRFIK